MEGIPVRYKRAMAPLDETARARLWESSSGDSEMYSSSSSSEGSVELSNLVDSFYDLDDEEGEEMSKRGGWIGNESEVREGDYGEKLRVILAEAAADQTAVSIKAAVEPEIRLIRPDAKDVNRSVMSLLRGKGFDAGICESSWDKSARFRARHHEYVDVLTSRGLRYIVEVNVSMEFEIARPTDEYAELLKALPKVFVARPDTLKGIVRLMCAAAKKSMKSMGMPLPPWRKREYMQGKWFSPHKRTDHGVLRTVMAAADAPHPFREPQKYCRMEFVRREGQVEGRLGI